MSDEKKIKNENSDDIKLSIKKILDCKEKEMEENIKNFRIFISEIGNYNPEYSVFNKNELRFLKECKKYYKKCHQLCIEINLLKNII